MVSVIISTWRSGSSFLGEMVASHPATIYFFEPLMRIGSRRVRSSGELDQALSMVSSILGCSFSNVTGIQTGMKT